MKKIVPNGRAMRAGLLLFLLVVSVGSYAQKELPPVNQELALRATAAGCAPATSGTELDLNNVRALVNTGGNLWFDQISARYEIPKGSGHTVIYSGALWLAGIDFNSQLKCAAVQFRTGNDFWAGPLTTGGDAEITPDQCLAYDKHFVITKQEVEMFDSWFAAGIFDAVNGTNTQQENFPGYSVPDIITEWPAHGNTALGQDFYLAPFYDRDGDGIYNPTNGDYPWYDLEDDVDCQSANDRRVTLFGDKTLWWVFNDKGNIHTESGSDPIGMEIRAQAFAFATNDAVNNMTFYNYELINRGTQTLFDTYFGTWVDTDLGGYDDDYVGCDVMRGLGYAYNGDAFDEDFGYALGFGANPPAIAVDFFEGPYQDNDGIDNAFGIGPDEALNGIGYGDGIADNERYGMRRFLYHNRQGQGNIAQTPPTTGIDYYNYLRGIWLDGTKFVYGGSAHISDPEADPGIPCDFMFPGDSDPLGWGTGGITSVPDWTEQSSGNVPFDRRFMQSAGPFTLTPGAVNNITVGVVYARAYQGDPFASVEAVRVADDKAQALFENCFKVLDGPDAPEVTIQELDKELILTLWNAPTSNNATEEYEEVDPFIPETVISTITSFDLDTATGQYTQTQIPDTVVNDRIYRFQGYQIFQLKDESIGPADLRDPDLARLVAQCDLEDGIGQIINYEFNESINASVPVELVAGADEGIAHSFKMTEDQFAQGNRRLVNHKKYYYMAIAYAYNNYKTYDPSDSDALDGQKFPYKASRKGGSGAIKSYVGIPHITNPENGGTVQVSEYGDGPEITRIEGKGNGGLVLDLTRQTEAEILASSSHKADFARYQRNAGPIDVKVIDPLNVPDVKLRLRFAQDSVGTIDNASWIMTVLESNDESIAVGTNYDSDKGIGVGNEQIFPDLGISVHIEQYHYQGTGNEKFTELLEASVVYEDSSRAWLIGIPDQDGLSPQNWIRSGNSNEDSNPTVDPNPNVYNDYIGVDDEEIYEGVLGGVWSPWRLVADEAFGPAGPIFANTITMPDIADVQSVDLVITSDQSKWTRAAVIEQQESTDLSQNGAEKMQLRNVPSVGKNGLPDGSISPGGNPSIGMGWFPGYAINQETGERMHIAFGEDSWLAGENGRDMLWNPTNRDYSILFQPLFAGRHYVYIFNNDFEKTGDSGRPPQYDGGYYLESTLEGGNSGKIKLWRSVMWVGLPLLAEGEEFMSNEVRVRLRAGKSYENYITSSTVQTDAGGVQGDPVYEFSLTDLATTTEDLSTAEDALALINVVPNPYYAFSEYEENRIDNRVKITNLPNTCRIRIYTVNGTLIRTYDKDNGMTSVDWDLKNQASVPISGGVYLIHVEVPGVGEKVVKWFGAMRPPDLENF